MKTKHFLLSLLMLFSSIALNAQTDENKIKAFVMEYFTMLQEGGLVTSLDYIYPELFKIAPRESLEAAFASMMADTTMKISFSALEIKEVSAIVEEEKRSFAQVDYSYIMGFQLMKSGNLAEDEETNSFLLGLYQSQYGEEKVAFDEANNTFNISVDASLIAISDPQYEGLKMLEKKPELEEILKTMVPESVLQQFE